MNHPRESLTFLSPSSSLFFLENTMLHNEWKKMRDERVLWEDLVQLYNQTNGIGCIAAIFSPQKTAKGRSVKAWYNTGSAILVYTPEISARTDKPHAALSLFLSRMKGFLKAEGVQMCLVRLANQDKEAATAEPLRLYLHYLDQWGKWGSVLRPNLCVLTGVPFLFLQQYWKTNLCKSRLRCQVSCALYLRI